MIRWVSGGWKVYNLGTYGPSVCNNVSAAQGQIDASTYRLYVYCTDTSNSSTGYVAYATSDTATTFTWTTFALGDSVLSGRGNIIGATARPSGSYNVLDAFFLSAHETIIRVTRDSSGSITVQSLGSPVETDIGISGGIVAVPNSNGYARVFYNGKQASGNYLYERAGTWSGTNSPTYYRDHGQASPEQVATFNGQHAEGMFAEYHGTVAINMVNRPGFGNYNDYPRTHFFWATADGVNMPASWTEISNTVNHGGTNYQYSYVSDATTVVASSGRAYAFQEGIMLQVVNGQPQCTYDGLFNYSTQASIYYTTTTNGTTFTTPTEIAFGQGAVPLDHPFVDVQRGGGTAGADRIHITWLNTGFPGSISYGYLDDGFTFQGPWTLTLGGGIGAAYAPRITVNELGDVVVYMQDRNSLSDAYICKVSGTTCLGGWQHIAAGSPNAIQIDASDVYDDRQTCSSKDIKTVAGLSMAVSKTEAGRAYFCFQKSESPYDGKKDVYCTTGTLSGSTWSWATPIAINTANDGFDQFMPEVQSTSDASDYSTAGTVFVHWYDRSDDPNNCLFRAKKAMSTNRAQSFSIKEDFYSVGSNPAWLPVHCATQDLFIGDYSATLTSTLHSHGLYVTVPTGISQAQTNLREGFYSLGSWAQ